jgi:small GTP-binding protein
MWPDLRWLCRALLPWSQHPPRVIIVGLDAAGKTTILYRLKLGEVVTTIPTIGFNVETVQAGGVTIVCWDIGGKDKVRPLWRHYYTGSSAVVAVVDAHDVDRLDDAVEEIAKVIETPELEGVAALVLLNKVDLPGDRLSADKLHKLLSARLQGALPQQFYIQECSATKGTGMAEGFAWLGGVLEAPRVFGRSIARVEELAG